MGDKRTPIAIAKLNGSYEHNKGRHQAREATMPIEREAIRKTPPEHLTPLERKLWLRILQIIPEGVLGSCDEIILESLARLWAKLRDRTITDPQMNLLKNILCELGMTPASRSKVICDPAVKAKQAAAKNKNPEDEFIN